MEWQALHAAGVTFKTHTKYHTMSGVMADLKSDSEPPSLQISLRAGTAFGRTGQLYLWMTEHRLQTSGHRLSRDVKKGIPTSLHQHLHTTQNYCLHTADSISILLPPALVFASGTREVWKHAMRLGLMKT
jgi:hypothetical protein